MSGVTDLVEFLRARLDEWAVLAQRAIDGPRNAFVSADEDVEPLLFDDEGVFVLPAQVLREIEAKREIIRFYEEAVGFVEMAKSHGREATHYEVAAESYLNVIRAHAAVYADHPEYKESWRP